MSGRVRGTVGPPGLTGVCVLSTEWKLKGVAAGVSVPVLTQSSLSLVDVGLTLTFCTWRHSFVYTSELPLSSGDMWYITERKVRSMGFSEAVYFLQGTHTALMDWGSKADHLVT